MEGARVCVCTRPLDGTLKHQIFTDWTNNYPVLSVGGALLGSGEIAANTTERHYGFKNQI